MTTRAHTIAVVAACPFPAPRGTPIRIRHLAEEMAARGHRILVVTYPLGGGATVDGVTIHRIGPLNTERELRPGPTLAKLAWYDPRLALTLRQVLRQEQVDVIHAHHYEGVLIGAAARAGTGIPLVFDAHTLLGAELPTYRLGVPQRISRGIGLLGDRRLPGLADHVASCSERIRTRLIAIGAVPESRVTVVPNGVELELFAQRPGSPAQPHPAPTLVFSGNLSAYQGVDLMLEAFRQVRSRRPDARLRIVTGDRFDGYEEQARALGVREAIDLVPAHIDSLPGELASADVALNPRTDCTGVPVKLLNYLAAGRPVVSFAGAAPGLEHRRTAWLVQNDDTGAFADGIVTLLEQPALAAELGQSGRRFVEANHSWARSADVLEDIFASLVERRITRR